MFSKYVLSQLFLVTIFVILPGAFSGPTELVLKIAKADRSRTQLGSKGTLKYGDPCHSVEAKNVEIMNKAMEEILKIPITSFSLLEAEYDKVNEALEFLLSTDSAICNSKKLLTCDKISKRCGCGLQNSPNQKFSYVRDSRGRCRFARDTPCIYLNNSRDKFHACDNDTNCIFTSRTGETLDCNEHNYSKATSIGPDAKVKIPHCHCKSQV